MNTSRRHLTERLNAWAAGDHEVSDTTFDLVYSRLHKIAAAHFSRESKNSVLQTTGLLHEAFLRISEQSGLTWRSREHFFAFASRVMRRLLVDYARWRSRGKRGGEAVHVPLGETPEMPQELRPDIVGLREVLEDLRLIDPEKALVIELRFFGGLSVRETAAALGVSESTVHRQWRLARAWLFDALNRGPREAY